MKQNRPSAGLLLATTCVVLVGCSSDTRSHTQSEYAGQETRSIKSLAANEVSKYLNGEGMGYAKAAELNGYPGPRHVLDLAAELDLSAPQIQHAEQVFANMNADARRIGKDIVAKEGALDSLFVSGGAVKADIGQVVREIAVLEGDLRNAHLFAHLEMKSVLSQEQLAAYSRLRGYHGGDHNPAMH